MWARGLGGCAIAASLAACTLLVSTSELSGGAPDATAPTTSSSSTSSSSGGTVPEAGLTLTADGGVTATSCKALLAITPPPQSGVYTIDPDGSGPGPSFAAYCDVTGDGGGWTLLFKASHELGYGDPYWTDTRTFQPDKPDLDLEGAKLEGYMSMPFDEVRVGIRESGASVVRYIVLPVKAPSLRALITGPETKTSVGRDAWLSLFTSPGSQKNCNAEGFNVSRGDPNDRFANVRVGIVFNNESHCNSSDSYIGLGGWEGTGNHASTNGSAGTPHKPNEFGYLEVR